MLGDGTVRDLPGGVEQYLELRHGQANAVAAQAKPRPGAEPATRAEVSPSGLREARKTMARVERQLARLAGREERMHAEMAAAAADHATVLALNAQLREIVDERETLELEWLEAADILE